MLMGIFENCFSILQPKSARNKSLIQFINIRCQGFLPK